MKQWWSRWYGGPCSEAMVVALKALENLCRQERRREMAEFRVNTDTETVAGHPASCLLPRDKESRCECVNGVKKSKLTFCLLMLLCIFFICLWLWTETYCIVAYLPSCLKFAISPAVRLKEGSSRKVRVIHRYSYLLKEQIVANACTHAHTHATEWESHIVLATGYNWF